MATHNQKDSDSPVCDKPGWMNGMYFDERGYHSGINFPYYSTGVHQVSMDVRRKDAKKYEHIWRAAKHAPNLDPADIKRSQKPVDQLVNDLNARLQSIRDLQNEARTQDDATNLQAPFSTIHASEMEFTEVESVSLLQGMRNTLFGIEYDMEHWPNLPGNKATDKAKFVFCRDNRLKFLLLMLLPILLFIIVWKMCI